MRKVLIILLAILMVFALVACNDEPETGKWVSTYNETETEDEHTYEMTITATLEFDGKGGAKMTTYLDKVLMDGLDITGTIPEDMRTEVMTGTYTDTEITLTYEEGGITVTEKGSYSISGDKLTVTAEGVSHVFTKQ